MNLHTLIFTECDAYKSGKRITPKGVMVHSTGANNPELRRYVAPDDGLLGKNMYNNHWNMPGVGASMHAFIGKLKDGTIATYQVLPWDYKAGHCYKGVNGSGNNTHLAFEICEDGLTDPVYFGKVYQEAVELTAMLCEKFDLDPLADGVVICHYEGYFRGIASNHGDVLHWFPKHGKSMDDFRADVKAAMKSSDKPVEPEKRPAHTNDFETGDIVKFAGGQQYKSSDSTTGFAVGASLAKITNTARGAKHPYHCRAVDSNGIYTRGVYGWVDASTLSAIKEEPEKPVVDTKPAKVAIKKNDVVTIAKGATYYNGGSVPSWVLAKQWIVAEDPTGDRVVIDKSADGKNAINSPINAKYLTVVGVDTPWIPDIGDIVIYNGNKHYANANAVNGSPCQGGRAKITNIHELGKSKHPYHLVRVYGKGSDVYGWVDEGTFIKA